MRMTIEGTVQGVGFRPTVQKIATSLGLNGRVWNDGSMVIIDVDNALLLRDTLMKNLPPLAKVERIKIDESPTPDCTGFFIVPSKNTSKSASIPADTAVCDKCLREMRGQGRRKGYAFTTCTDCGSRFTLLSSLPYDRDRTAMSDFLMCVDCRNEYQMIENRRFHHQTICCPKCGPRYRLIDRKGIEISGDPISTFAKMLDSGKIGIAKSWGGMHICCTLENVRRLREIYHRPQKPFAIMVRNIEVAKKYVILTEKEKELLTSPNRPIVLANKNNELLTEEIAPGLNNVGIFLPYTGMQYMLFDYLLHDALVMTSANISGEPMIIRNDGVSDELETDYYLLHDQKIINRADDSVVRVFGNKTLFIRKSRGFIPSYLETNSDVCAIGIGAQENLSGTISTNGRLYSTQHIGNGESFNVIEYLETATDSLISLLGCTPQIVSMDIHPGYTNRKYGKRLSEKYNIPLLEVQHHWAHAASLLAETKETESVVLAIDGTGYGDDGNAWGGEVLITSLEGYDRVAHLQYFPLIGGEKAVMDPVRLKFAIDEINGVDSGLVSESIANVYRKMMSNSILTSSMGRFLDAISVTLGICDQRTYNGEPAMKTEPFLSKGKFVEGFSLKTKNGVIETVSMFKDIPCNVSKADIVYTMTKSVIDEMANIACDNAIKKGIETVGLTGGVSYNAPICKMAEDAVKARGLKFIMHDKVPCGDGGISVGQAVIAQQSIH